MDFSELHTAWLWFAAGLIAAAVEIFLPSFFMIFVGLATLAPVLVALLGFGFTAQLVSFGLTLLATILFIRPLIVKRFRSTKAIPSRTDRLIGHAGLITETIDPQAGSGRIMVMGEDWAASSTEMIPQGQTAEVTGFDGVTLLVKRFKQQSH